MSLDEKFRDSPKAVKVAAGILVFFLFMAILRSCMTAFSPGPGSQSKPSRVVALERPNPDRQADRLRLLEKIPTVHRGFKSPRDSGIDVIVGPDWFRIPYDDKSNYASIAATWALCEHYAGQDSYVVRFRDWRDEKEVATAFVSSNLGYSFEVR